MWYRNVLVPGDCGGYFKRMSHKDHKDNLKTVFMAKGVPGWSANIHIPRRAAAQKVKERGASESYTNNHQLLSVGPSGGAYDLGTLIPANTRTHSEGAAICSAPSTKRLTLPVLEMLKQKVAQCLKEAEKALGKRVAADSWAQDKAMRELFSIIHWQGSMYFLSLAAHPSWASVAETAYVNCPHLLRNAAFATDKRLVRRMLTADGEIGAGAATHLLPH